MAIKATGISIINPGTTPPYTLSTSVCDVAIVYENSYATYSTAPPTSYIGSPVNVGLILFSCPSANYQAVMQFAQKNGYQWIFLTDQTGYTGLLPSYFSAMNTASISPPWGWAKTSWNQQGWQ